MMNSFSSDSYICFSPCLLPSIRCRLLLSPCALSVSLCCDRKVNQTLKKKKRKRQSPHRDQNLQRILDTSLQPNRKLQRSEVSGGRWRNLREGCEYFIIVRCSALLYGRKWASMKGSVLLQFDIISVIICQIDTKDGQRCVIFHLGLKQTL